MPTKHRVWIEVEKPWTKGEGFDHALGHERAALFSQLLIKLGVPAEPAPVWWNDRKGVFCYNRYGHGGFVEMGDSGEWFNLEGLV